MNKFKSVSDEKYLRTLSERKVRNIPKDFHSNGKKKRDHEIDLAYEMVENLLITELTEADCREDVESILYTELANTIDQHDLDIEVEDVMPHFWDVYRLKEVS